jgi:hypothetical protein
MKTEIMLDDAMALEIQEVAKESHITFGEALQEVLSAGLPAFRTSRKNEPFRVIGHDFGTALENPKAMLAQLEEEEDLERYRRGGG